MFAPTTPSPLILACKDCHQPVSDSENNAYRLIAGVLYGWCNECFNKRRRRSTDERPNETAGRDPDGSRN